MGRRRHLTARLLLLRSLLLLLLLLVLAGVCLARSELAGAVAGRLAAHRSD